MLGERIANYRKKVGMSQEKVAECLGVSRQVVTISKAPWMFIGISFVVLLLYIILGMVKKIISPGTVITGFIVLIPIQLFLHLYFLNAIKNESFNGIAGYDSKISYDLNVLKRILAQIDINICMSSTVYIFLNCAVDIFHLGYIAHAVVFVIYIVDFVAVILINNYSMIDKLYKNDEDKERARKGMPLTVGYLILLFVGLLVTLVVFEVKGIENNTAPAMKVITLLILGISFATAGYAVESKNISKWKPGESIYKISKISIVGVLFSVVLFGFIFFV